MEGRLMRHQPAFLIYSLYDTGSKLLNNVSHVLLFITHPCPIKPTILTPITPKS